MTGTQPDFCKFKYLNGFIDFEVPRIRLGCASSAGTREAGDTIFQDIFWSGFPGKRPGQQVATSQNFLVGGLIFNRIFPLNKLLESDHGLIRR